MRWNLQDFGSNETYEHEFFLDASDSNRTYLSTAQSLYPNCMPTTTSVQSTWGTAAAPYLDTRLEEPGSGFCEAGWIGYVSWIGYVIGAGNAIAISNGVTHYNYIRTYNGNANSDIFRLRAQVGYRDPGNCYTTWCSYGYSEVPRVILVPPTDFSVPGVRDWVRP